VGPLKRWHAGDLITHGRLNKMQARAELAARVRGSGATTVGVSTTGIRVGTPYAAKALPFLLQAGLTYVASTWQPPYTDGAQALHYNPATGTYSPEAGRTARLYHPLGARDGNNVYLPIPAMTAGMVVYAAWNRQSGRWEIVWWSAKYWAVAQSDWEENGSYPAGDPKVSVRVCDRKGENEGGSAFDVYLPRNPRSPSGKEHDADPAVYEGWVIGWELDSEGTPICTTPYLHMGKIKDIRIQGADDIVPTGWHECDGSNQTGNAGAFDLANFKREYALGNPPHTRKVGAFPRHRSDDEAIGVAGCWSHMIDAIGQHGGVEGTEVVHVFDHTPQGVPVGSEAQDDAGDAFAVEGGEYPAETVLFIQRYK